MTHYSIESNLMQWNQWNRGGILEVFSEYLAGLPDDERREQMRRVLNGICERFPQLVPRIAWNQPMFTDHGTFIIGFSASKMHMSVAPERKAMMEFAQAIEDAGYSATKELFRIRWGQEVEETLIDDIILFNRKDKANCRSFWRE